MSVVNPRGRMVIVKTFVVLASVGCCSRKDSSVSREPQLGSRMVAHATYAKEMRDAIAANDLVAARHAANVLAHIPIESNLGSGLRDRLSAMTAAAEQVARAHEAHDAARKVARLAQTCGDCHTSFGGPQAVFAPPEQDASSVRGQMAWHEWAIARMWDGLTVPSDQAWQEGAKALANARLEPPLLTLGQTPVPRVAALAELVHGIAMHSPEVAANARSAVYGELLGTCVDCHQWLGGGPDSRVIE